ncbi:AAA family ATPase [Rhizobium metallidurans]|uniref:ATP-dependent Zn protease n=1 Tax=Rhizobium metallidurans TaxID=1265931 RepID=A0A7W6D0W0_9HYPH|nr:AAA family ATPase [Rhizobium metallidurans]MBB3967235.1 ATP-dependent Zn protease [Rhizobium metallidurans]
MKNHITPRKRFGLPEQLAYASLRSAIRPLLRADAFVAVVVIPPDADIGPYFRAADAMLSSTNRYRRTAAIVDFDAKKPLNSARQIANALDEKKVVILFPDEASITVAARLAADVVVHLNPPTTDQVKGVFRLLYGGRLTDQQAEIFLLLDDEMQRAVVRPGRSVGRMLAQLVMRPEAPHDARKPPPVRRDDDDVELRLESMSGYGEAREWGLQLKQDLKDWKDGRISWSDVDRGLLLSGPPGVGKTIYAEALANTCGAKLVVGSAARWQAKGHLGDMQRAMFKAFEDARKAAPAILFIDEIDGFTDRESDHGHNSSYVRQVINSFLECLDGTVNREGVVVVGACNNPVVIDPAILRPGRLDNHVRLPLPDARARVGILRHHLRGDLLDEDFDQFAEDSFGLTGADIARIVRLARRVARRDRRAVTVADIMGSLPGRVPLSEKFRWALAIHELGHAVVAVATGARKVWGVSIESRASASLERQILGGAVLEGGELANNGKQFYLDNIAIHMGGMAAEQVFVGHHGDGVASDLDGATRLAIILDRHLGMNGMLASWPAGVDERLIDSARRVDGPLLKRIEPVLQEQLARAKTIVESYRTSVEGLWLELIGAGHLTGQQIVDGLKPDNKKDMPTPKTRRRKIRQRLHG